MRRARGPDDVVRIAGRLATGPGTGTCAHRTPFQCSIRARSRCPSLNVPTAQTSRADTAATPRSTLLRPGGVNGDTDQAEPFQCSIRPRSPPPSSVRPTAQTSLTATADTASSRFPARPGFWPL